MDKADTSNQKIIIMGDININFFCQKSNECKDTLILHGFKQLLTKATRITNESSMLIDVIATNKSENISKSDVIPLGISDHNLIGCIRKMNSQKYERKIINTRNYHVYNKKEMLSDLCRVDWNLLYKLENVKTTWKFISDNLRKNFNKHAPKIEKRVKGRLSPWITNEIADCMNKRNQLLNKAQKSGRQEHWKIYKKRHNGCTKMIQKAKGDYHKRLLQENSRNLHNFWKYIKEIISNK